MDNPVNMPDKVEGANAEGVQYGVKAERPVHIENFRAANVLVGIHLGNGSSGSIVRGAHVSGGTVGFMIGGDPEKLSSWSVLRDQIPELRGCSDADIEEAAKVIANLRTRDERIEGIKQTKLGRFLAQGGFVGWSNLVLNFVKWVIGGSN